MGYGNDIFSRLAVPLDNNNGFDSIVSSTLKKAPYIALVDFDREKGVVVDLSIVSNTLRSLKRTSCLDIMNWLIGNGAEIIVIPESDTEALNIVEKVRVDFIVVEPGMSLREIIETYLRK